MKEKIAMFDNVHFDVLTAIFLIIVHISICSAVAIHIVLNKHEEAASALAWLIIVFSFPVTGTLFYFLFGINRVYTRGIQIKMAHELISSHKNDPQQKPINEYLQEQSKFIYKTEAPSEYPLFCQMMDRLLPESIPLTGNSIELLLDGTKAYPRMLEEIEKAEKNINLQSFIIMYDAIGIKILDSLEKKARQGVKVKIIFDKFGSAKSLLSLAMKYYHKKVPNFDIRPFAPFNLKAPWSFQLRNHRKLLIIDGKTAFIGGINISDDNDKALSRKDHYIHDLHCMIRGPAAGEFQISFLRDWYYVTYTNPSELFTSEFFPLPEKYGESMVRMVDSGPGQNYEASEKIFMTGANTAQRYVWIMTPYFVPEKSFWKMLCTAVARGVEVRIIIPEKNNHWYIQYATQSLFRVLLESGVRIYQKEGSFSHAKAMLVDGTWAVMGSSNCDVRSFRLNYELDFAVTKGDFLDVLHSQFLKEISESKEVMLADVIHKNLRQQMLENLCSLLTPVL